jgi:hypothetical protein
MPAQDIRSIGGAAIALTAEGNLPMAVQKFNIPTTFTTGQKAVTTAGTRVALVASSTPLAKGIVRITAHPNNTGLIYVGGAAVSSVNGEVLSPDKTLIMEIDDLNKIWLDTSVSGHSVSFLAY